MKCRCAPARPVFSASNQVERTKSGRLADSQIVVDFNISISKVLIYAMMIIHLFFMYCATRICDPPLSEQSKNKCVRMFFSGRRLYTSTCVFHTANCAPNSTSRIDFRATTKVLICINTYKSPSVTIPLTSLNFTQNAKTKFSSYGLTVTSQQKRPSHRPRQLGFHVNSVQLSSSNQLLNVRRYVVDMKNCDKSNAVRPQLLRHFLSFFFFPLSRRQTRARPPRSCITKQICLSCRLDA